MTAAPQATMDWLTEQMGRAGKIRAKRMFGEWGLYCDDRFFGLVCDGELFLKPTAAVAKVTGGVEGTPYPGAKPHLWVPQEDWDDADLMARLVRLTVDNLPPAPSKRPRRGPSPSMT